MGVKVREKVKGSGEWWIFIDHRGKRKSRKIGKDKRLAREVARKIEARLVLGEMNLEKAESKMPTFGDVAGLWIAWPHDWKESTRENYRDNLTNHVFPVFEKVQIDQITRKDLKLFFDKKYSNGLKLQTIKVLGAPINGVLSHAVRELEVMEHNPMRDVVLNYKKNDLEIEPLTGTESIALLEQARIFQGGIWYPVILCALRTGMRIGEIQALKWTEIDLENRIIEVKRSWRKGRITDTKSKKRRRVDMTPQLAEALRELKGRFQLKVAGEVNASPFVFSGVRQEMLSRNSFRRAMEYCLKVADLKRIRVHDLRHSYATIRLMRGHNVGDVSYQLGHSSIKITYDTYGHWIPGSFKSEVDELDNVHPSAPYTHPETGIAQNLL